MSGAQLLPSGLLPSRRAGQSHGDPRQQGPGIALGYPGRCPHTPTCLTCVFDNSGSVGSSGGNDPIGNRFAEARLAIEAVGRRCRCHQELVAVVHFDTPTRGDVPPTPLTRLGLRWIRHGLAVPSDGAGASLLGPSLRSAYEITEQWPDHEHVLVVLSDFELFDHDLPAVLDDFADFPGLVHAVVLRATPPAQLLEDERVQVTSLGHGDPHGAVAQALFASLTAYRRPAHRLAYGRRFAS